MKAPSDDSEPKKKDRERERERGKKSTPAMQPCVTKGPFISHCVFVIMVPPLSVIPLFPPISRASASQRRRGYASHPEPSLYIGSSASRECVAIHRRATRGLLLCLWIVSGSWILWFCSSQTVNNGDWGGADGFGDGAH